MGHLKNRAKKATRTIRDLFYSCTEDTGGQGKAAETHLEGTIYWDTIEGFRDCGSSPISSVRYIKYINEF